MSTKICYHITIYHGAAISPSHTPLAFPPTPLTAELTPFALPGLLQRAYSPLCSHVHCAPLRVRGAGHTAGKRVLGLGVTGLSSVAWPCRRAMTSGQGTSPRAEEVHGEADGNQAECEPEDYRCSARL